MNPFLIVFSDTGGFCTIGQRAESRYHGLFLPAGNSFFRILEDICPEGHSGKPVLTVESEYSAFRRFPNGVRESFVLQGETLLYERDTQGNTDLFLDFREAYNANGLHRDYDFQEEEDGVRIRFQNLQFLPDSSLFIKTDQKQRLWSLEWVRREYSFDAEREGGEGEFYVLRCRLGPVRRISLSLEGRKKWGEENIESENIWEVSNDSSNLQKATHSSAIALRGLLSERDGRKGLFAGHPWFFQFWTRDEAISAKGLCLAGKRETAKRILLGALSRMDSTGRIPNRYPASDLSSADGVGWIFFRLRELFREGFLLSSEQEMVKNALQTSLQRLEKKLLHDGLFYNGPLETWMDTGFQSDTREGYCIEIQALMLSMYAFLHELAPNSPLTTGAKGFLKQTSFRERIRQAFWNGQFLRDEASGNLLRPNLFLAAYIAPEILSKSEWKSCFDAALEKLWLSWGGLSTIEKNHPLFHAHYTGENNRSYHRGDSWFFVNHLVAIALYRTDKKQYAEYIQKIQEASTAEILHSGAIGCCAEVSSAQERRSEGCFNQAWSNATFLEMAREIGK
ncbi:hypothetical protein IPN35_03170 [Candidatus Peregrinibacteria bacterium]|nr:MAG: hypothetical protein IPN35_03170 [Candidatus Peregrinibacteria bacterium]